MELEIENTEVVSADHIQIEAPGSVEVVEGEKDYEVSVVKKEYTIIGDSIFIPSMYEDAPPWLKEFIDTTLEVAITNRDQSLIDRMEAILTLMDYVPKNKYTEQINQIVSEDGIINSRIATLNSNLTDAISSTNATVAEINLTYASKNEAAAIATNVLTASLSGNGEIGSVLIQLQEAYADLESTTAQSISMLESVMEGEINGNAQAMETIRTYVGIDETGASTGVGTLDIILNNIQNQVDGSISTWFYNSEPTLYNLPASEWTTTETRNIHLGDIYYDRSTGFAYRFAFEDIEDIPDAGIIYTWLRITDSDITKALADAAQAQETADGKITTYYQDSAPIAEGVGDIWIDSNDGNKMYRWNGSTWGSDLVGTMVASSQAITTLQTNLNSTNTTVSGHTTQLNTVDTRISSGMASVETKWAYNSIVNINGVYKKSGFGLTTNYTSGNGTQADPYVSEFWIDASRLKFTNSNQTGQTAPFTIDASGTTPQVKFNGVVEFSNVTNVPQLGSTPQEVVNAVNSGQTTTINGGKITTNSITSDKISTYNLTSTNATIQNGLITNAKIADASITAAKIVDGNITNAKIGDAQITTAKIGDLSVSTLKIQDEAVIVPRSTTNTSLIYYPAIYHSVTIICKVDMSFGGYNNNNSMTAYLKINGIVVDSASDGYVENANYILMHNTTFNAGTVYTISVTTSAPSLSYKISMIGTKK